MYNIEVKKKKFAHENAVSAIIEHPQHPELIITIGHDSFLRVWNADDLKM